MKNKAGLAALLAAALVVPTAFAQNQGSTTAAGASQQGSGTKMDASRAMGQDHHFLMEAAKGGMMEVELGRLAAQRAANQEVKSFGQRMVTDHSKANERLMQLANEEGVKVPSALEGEAKATHDRLAKMSGAEFDREYMSHMVMDHKKDVAMFEKQAEKGQEADVKAFAQTTLPTLREHLKMAQDLAGKVGATRASR